MNSNRATTGTEEANSSKKSTRQTKLSTEYLISPASEFQITNLDDEHPLMKLGNNSNILDNDSSAISNSSLIDGRIYSMNWLRLIGTDLIFDDYGELIGNVKEHLNCDSSVKVKIKDDNSGDDDIKTESNVKEKAGDGEVKTKFYRKILRMAQMKANSQKGLSQEKEGSPQDQKVSQQAQNEEHQHEEQDINIDKDISRRTPIELGSIESRRVTQIDDTLEQFDPRLLETQEQKKEESIPNNESYIKLETESPPGSRPGSNDEITVKMEVD